MLMFFISKIVRRENCPRFHNRPQFSPHVECSSPRRCAPAVSPHSTVCFIISHICPHFQNRPQLSPHDRETHSGLYPAWSGDIMLNGVFAELVARQQLDS